MTTRSQCLLENECLIAAFINLKGMLFEDFVTNMLKNCTDCHANLDKGDEERLHGYLKQIYDSICDIDKLLQKKEEDQA